MNRKHLKVLVRAFAGACLAVMMFVSTARADFIDQAEVTIDATHSLPYSLQALDKGFRNCDPDSDDVTACADAVAPIAESAGIDQTYVYDAANIYVDIRRKDYWALFSDAGELAACAVAEIITGAPICGIITDVYKDAKAIYDWFVDLFGSDNTYVPHIGETGHSCLDAGFPYELKNGQCSHCPFDQALINGKCGYCPGPTQSMSFTPDKRCMTLSGTTQQSPAADGSSCNQHGGYQNPQVCCEIGLIYVPEPSGHACASPGSNSGAGGPPVKCSFKDPKCTSQPSDGAGPHTLLPTKPRNCGTKRHWNGTTCIPNSYAIQPVAPPASSPRLAPMPGGSAEHAVEKSTLCRFTSGPRRGETQDYAPMTPLPIGTPCQDARGSSGTVVAR